MRETGVLEVVQSCLYWFYCHTKQQSFETQSFQLNLQVEIQRPILLVFLDVVDYIGDTCLLPIRNIN